jgi:hypothetical protein
LLEPRLDVFAEGRHAHRGADMLLGCHLLGCSWPDVR